MSGKTEANTARTVVIDNDSQHLGQVMTLLNDTRHACEGFTAARDALAYMRQNRVALVITDIFTPEMEAFETLRVICRLFPDVAVVALSSDGQVERDIFLHCAKRLGAVAALCKPLEAGVLGALLERYVEPLASEPATSCDGCIRTRE